MTHIWSKGNSFIIHYIVLIVNPPKNFFYGQKIDFIDDNERYKMYTHKKSIKRRGYKTTHASTLKREQNR